MKNVFALIFASIFALSFLSCEQSTGPNTPSPPPNPFPAPSAVWIQNQGTQNIRIDFTPVNGANYHRMYIREVSTGREQRIPQQILDDEMMVNGALLLNHWILAEHTFYSATERAGFRFGVAAMFPDGMRSDITWTYQITTNN